MSITSILFRMARASADARAITQSVKTGSTTPIFRRLTNKFVGRNILSKFICRG